MEDKAIETEGSPQALSDSEEATATTEENTARPQEKKAEKEAHPVRAFFRKAVNRYLIDAFSGMALGLFCTLIAGTIVGQIGLLIGDNAVGKIISYIGTAAKMIMGAGVGVGMAHSLKAGKLTTFTAAAAGMIGANITNIFAMSGVHIYGAPSEENAAIGIGDPVAAYFAAVFAIEVSRLVEGKTPIDIIVIPLLGITVGSIASMALGIPFGILFALCGWGIAAAVNWNPIIFGIIISAVMGMLLTLPTSSAAFGVMLFSSSLIPPELAGAKALAAAAACAGCCAHMVGFAVASFRENGWGGLVSQGIGTSMLQIPNLAKNPAILLPAVGASIVSGPLACAAFGLMCDSTGAGMGTAGLVGVIQTFTVSLAGNMAWWLILIGILVCYFIVPALVALGISELLRKVGLIKPGDMKLPK